MAITKDLSEITVDTTAGSGLVVDNTIYTSPVRANFGVFLKVYKVDYTGSRDYMTTTSNDSDPNTDSEWLFRFDSDGWHQLFYVAVPDWAVTSYAKYDAVFNPLTNIVYRSKVNANSVATAADLLVTANWEVISDPTQLCLNIDTASESENLSTLSSIGIINVILYPKLKEKFGQQTANAFLEQTSSYKRPQDVRLYELLGVAVDGMFIANERQEYILGELIARRATAICSTC